ncbi:MAG: hypothetical protein IJG85_03700 [Eubacteriaceae bacterium]|nr:hypothetical protein [Eubacteriaceae bacterium]
MNDVLMMNHRKSRTAVRLVLAVCVFLFSVLAISPVVRADNQGDPPQWILDKEGISRDDFMTGREAQHRDRPPTESEIADKIKKLTDQYISEGTEPLIAQDRAKRQVYTEERQRKARYPYGYDDSRHGQEKRVFHAFREKYGSGSSQLASDLMLKFFKVIDTPWDGWAAEFHRRQEVKDAQDIQQRLNGKHVTVTAKTGVEGKFFGSVSKKDVSKAIEAAYGLKIDKQAIDMPNIKDFGNYNFKVRIKDGVIADMVVEVVPEQNN